MDRQSHFRFEGMLPISNGWPLIVKNHIVPCNPNDPTSDYYNLHKPWYHVLHPYYSLKQCDCVSTKSSYQDYSIEKTKSRSSRCSDINIV
jgi:hypothetical protein